MRFAALSLFASALSPRATSSFSTPSSLLSRHFSVCCVSIISRRAIRIMSTNNNNDKTPSINMMDTTDNVKQALLNCPTIPLRDGTQHPAIGFGTYKVGFIPSSASAATSTMTTHVERSAQECVRDALDVGYRFLECAQFYGNEKEVGNAIRDSGIPREELFLCSKVWTSTMEQGSDAIRAQVRQTLEDLQTDYLDLYLIHWPVPGKHVPAYQTLLELQSEGNIKGVGVSNYAWEDWLELKEAGVTRAPLVNQIEINPFLYRKNTISKFQNEGVVMQSYRSLRDGKAFDHVVLKEIAAAHDKTTAQILGRWCVQHGFVYVPKSVQKERMMENAQVFDFELTPQEMERLDHLTTPEALEAFQQLYRKCVNRDTSKDGTMEGVKMNITID
jgi:diketogulonate reductase-like aldo/keto reductase